MFVAYIFRYIGFRVDSSLLNLAKFSLDPCAVHVGLSRHPVLKALRSVSQTTGAVHFILK
eukprot:SAG31_NODE_2219_length_6158_cov_6.237168_6_plen_60_part_00